MRFCRSAAALLLSILPWWTTPALSQTVLPDCTVVNAANFGAQFGPVDHDATPAPCALNWVEGGRKMRVVWSHADEDFAVNLSGDAVAGFALSSARPPHLIDIDKDGWLDLGVLTLVGMVNSDYEFFRYDPFAQDFRALGAMNGAQFARDRAGYLVSDARSSCCARVISFHDIRQDSLEKLMEISVRGGEISGCKVTIGAQSYDAADGPDLLPHAPDLIEAYCNYYDDDAALYERQADLRPADGEKYVVPDGTVFHCALIGGTHMVTVTHDGDHFTYRYGPIGGRAELTLHRRAAEVGVRAYGGTEIAYFGQISFQNRGYTYQLHTTYDAVDRSDDQSAYARNNVARGLTVMKDDSASGPVFDKTCLAERAYDAIATLDAN
ncbi:hypothetical protein ACJ5NV_18145 [Loktanella agnita]|uniref:hypothetical protein n=1 Tax=Loktanella agnita TaxID=287097 RepID=UPI00398A1688